MPIAVVVIFTACLSEKLGKNSCIVKFSIISNALNIYANYTKNIQFHR